MKKQITVADAPMFLSHILRDGKLLSYKERQEFWVQEERAKQYEAKLRAQVRAGEIDFLQYVAKLKECKPE